jgi:hypothetical protein
MSVKKIVMMIRIGHRDVVVGFCDCCAEPALLLLCCEQQVLISSSAT